MKKESLKKIIGIIGIIITITHLTYYFINPYNLILFFLGFGVIYLVFIKWVFAYLDKKQ